MKSITKRMTKILVLLMVTVMFAVPAMTADVQAQTNAGNTSVSAVAVQNGKAAATSKKLNGVHKKNGHYYYYKNGKALKKSGWYKYSSKTSIYVGPKGYITAKVNSVAGSIRYYTINYKTDKWVVSKNVWRKVGDKQYYFVKNGIAKYIYNNNTGRLFQYANGKFAAVKNKLLTLSNGRIYFFSGSGKRASKQGWYELSSTVKIKVGSKGYVTGKFDSKAGHLYTYDYGKKKWTLFKTTTCKIGKNTYYFDSKGGLIRNQIAGNSKTGYYYVDSTGCKVSSKEIQTAVKLVMQNTKPSMTREQKLYACFMKIREYPYERDYTAITASASQFSGLALQAMNNGKANCYKYASAFACVATVLGYDARVICGKMPAYYGSGLTDHGWTELWDAKLKSWRLYDSCLKRDVYFNWKISDYFPGETPVDKTAQLTVANGKVTWKWVK